MRITIGDFELCGGRDRAEFPDSFAGGGEILIQNRQFLRAAAQKPLARGNAATDFAFTVEREYPTHVIACREAVLHHARLIGYAGTLKIEFQDDSGIAVVYLSDGVVRSHRWDPIIGVYVRHRYVCHGGLFSIDESAQITGAPTPGI